MNPLLLFKNEEFRAYLKVVIILASLLSLSLFIHYDLSIGECLTQGYFQVSSIISSTGFCSLDFATWDYTSKAILFLAMIAGSCASSAGGGIKIMRWLLVFKIMKSELAKILHPKAIFNIKIGKYSVPREILYQTLMFVFFYMAIVASSAFLVAIIEHNTTIGITGAVTATGNVGPGFGKLIGPLGSFAGLHPLSKIILTIDMFVGRLELIPFLVLFQKDLWNFKE